MESSTSADAPSAITFSEIMATYHTTIPEGQQIQEAKLKFEESSSGLIALSKPTLEKIVIERDTFLAQLIEANKVIDELRKKASTPAPSNADIAEHSREILLMNQERRELSEKLVTAEEKIKSSEEQRAKLQKVVNSNKVDYDELLADYYYIEDQYNRLRQLFKRSFTEVFRAIAEFREPRLRPKAAPGCLNCGVSGHSYHTCEKTYSGRFCQICCHPDFSTEECPSPHYTELPGSSERLRCKCCWRPLNLPDANCHECRKRMKADYTMRRYRRGFELEF